ncbi:Fic family protein [Acidisoma cellulosilytica]|uniref:Fic family protein n=1 Tax=Acidisoma cellulosilyticum TaxID=2802395 RepID=A0A964E5I0_9PROT|nr:Fic family protein [Acidisoma cellulosilyticum]MCB8882690.1 Fic family protein [Acidisoma cellulosilyticum]
MIRQALAPDRRHRTMRVAGQPDLILFSPLDLPRAVDVAPVISLLELVQYRCGRLAANLEALPDASALQRLLNRWDAVILGASGDRRADFCALLISEQQGDGDGDALTIRQGRNYAALSDQILERATQSDPLASPAQVEARIKAMHARLSAKTAAQGFGGSFRTQVTVAGGFVLDLGRIAPPPPEHIAACLTDVAMFIAAPPPIPLLLRIAMVWAQLIAIAPFEQGNQMLCQALAAEMAVREGYAPLFNAQFVLPEQACARNALRAAILEGVWAPWFCYFLQGVNKAIGKVQDVIESVQTIAAQWERRLDGTRQHSFARATAQWASCQPALTANAVRARFDVSSPTARAALARLVEVGILLGHSESRGRRLYVAPDILAIFSDQADGPASPEAEPICMVAATGRPRGLFV